MVLKIIIWNVEHGNAITIITPNKKRVIQDLGSNSLTGFSPIEYSLRKSRNRKVDSLIITHPHKDHIDDVSLFCKAGLDKEMRNFVRPMSINSDYFDNYIKKNKGWVSETDMNKFHSYLHLHHKFPNTYITKNSPLNPLNNGGVKFDFFKPKKCGLYNINNHSIVTIVTYQGKKIMLTGDNEIVSWKELLSNSKFCKTLKEVDIFLAPHHGRESGFYDKLFDYFTPRLVLVSDGPKTNTSAVKRYAKYVKEPYDVYFRNQGKVKKRRCLTTRNDKAIILFIDQSNMINVKTTS